MTHRQIEILDQHVRDLQDQVAALQDSVDAVPKLDRIETILAGLAVTLSEIKRTVESWKVDQSDKAAMQEATAQLNASSDREQAVIDANQPQP